MVCTLVLEVNIASLARRCSAALKPGEAAWPRAELVSHCPEIIRSSPHSRLWLTQHQQHFLHPAEFSIPKSSQKISTSLRTTQWPNVRHERLADSLQKAMATCKPAAFEYPRSEFDRNRSLPPPKLVRLWPSPDKIVFATAACEPQWMGELTDSAPPKA